MVHFEHFIAAFDVQSSYILSLALLILAAKAAGYLSQSMHQPAVLGEIIGGILLGPSLLGWIQPDLFLNQMAEIGVILLMFIAGLETNSALLQRVLKSAFFVALLGVAVPFCSGYFLGQWLGYPFTASLILGTILVATSVSITVQVLKEMDKLGTVEGTTILGAAVLDDILGFLVLSVVLTLVTTPHEAIQAGFLVMLPLKLVLFFVLLTAGSKLAAWILLLLKRSGIRSFITAGLLAVAFAFSFLAEALGLAGIVGAYLSGFLLSTAPHLAKHKHDYIQPIEMIGYAVFIPVFFAGIGLRLDLSQMTLQLIGLSALITLAAVFSKIFGCGLGARLSGLNRSASYRIGAGMVARGEVGLIVAMTAFQQNIIGHDLFSSAVLVVILTTLITPVLLSRAFN